MDVIGNVRAIEEIEGNPDLYAVHLQIAKHPKDPIPTPNMLRLVVAATEIGEYPISSKVKLSTLPMGRVLDVVIPPQPTPPAEAQ